MRHLTATLCLTLAVLLESVVCISTTSASEFIQARFGKVTLNIPRPNDLCSLGQSPLEMVVLNYQSSAQRLVGNKFLAMWIDCESQKTLQGGAEVQLQEWAIIVGTLSGTPKTERVYPLLSADKYLNMVASGYETLPINKVLEDVNRSLEEANDIYLGDKNTVSVADPINLGVVGVEDAVHTGMIFNVKTKIDTVPTLGVYSALLIKGVPVNHYFYRPYKGVKTFKNVFTKAKYYSARIIHAN